jgi:hypothetical protein
MTDPERIVTGGRRPEDVDATLDLLARTALSKAAK